MDILFYVCVLLALFVSHTSNWEAETKVVVASLKVSTHTYSSPVWTVNGETIARRQVAKVALLQDKL